MRFIAARREIGVPPNEAIPLFPAASCDHEPLLPSTCTGGPPLEAQLTLPLTPEEVACNEDQLERMVARMSVRGLDGEPTSHPHNLLLTYSSPFGFYEGVAVYDWFLRDRGAPSGVNLPGSYAEPILAFNINPTIRELLLNSERLPLPQVSLNREQSASRFNRPGSCEWFLGGDCTIVLTLDTTLAGAAEPDLATINSWEESLPGEPYNGFLANSTKPGRGLIRDGLVTPCHTTRFTEFDRHVFAILQRIVRIRAADEIQFGGGDFFYDVKVTLFRDPAPLTYRINAYPVGLDGEAFGRLALRLEVTATPEGRLRTGTLSVLPICQAEGQLGCTDLALDAEVCLAKPTRLGQFIGTLMDCDGGSTVSLDYDGDDQASLPSPALVDFEALLNRTTWNP